MSNRLYSVTTDDRHKSIKKTFSLSMSVSQGIRKLDYTAISSIVRAMMQISDLKVIQGAKIEDLSSEKIRRITTGSMFLKEKFYLYFSRQHADGSFEELKFRLVAGGYLQDRDMYDNGRSPTLSTSSLFILSAIASHKKAVALIDFP